jgi:hypothetical protein
MAKTKDKGMAVQGISAGGFIKNGYNRYFYVASITEAQTVLAEYNGNGATGKELHLSTAVFAALAKNKNYATVQFGYIEESDRWAENLHTMVGTAAVGGNRFLIKPAKFQFR